MSANARIAFAAMLGTIAAVHPAGLDAAMIEMLAPAARIREGRR